VENKNDRYDAFAGGITGWLTTGIYSINDCYSLGNITAEYTGASDRWVMAGGILGTTSSNSNSIGIRHCYAAGIVQAIHHGNSSGPIISGGIAGELYSGQVTHSNENTLLLDNNMYLGSSIQAKGPGNRYIRFLYAYGPNAGVIYKGLRWEDAKKQESSTAGGPLSVITGGNNLDGEDDAATSVLNGTWPSNLGFISTTWGSYTNDFSTPTRLSDNSRGIKRPTLVNNQEP
jgi:hypothetical protein